MNEKHIKNIKKSLFIKTSHNILFLAFISIFTAFLTYEFFSYQNNLNDVPKITTGGTVSCFSTHKNTFITSKKYRLINKTIVIPLSNNTDMTFPSEQCKMIENNLLNISTNSKIEC